MSAFDSTSNGLGWFQRFLKMLPKIRIDLIFNISVYLLGKKHQNFKIKTQLHLLDCTDTNSTWITGFGFRYFLVHVYIANRATGALCPHHWGLVHWYYTWMSSWCGSLHLLSISFILVKLLPGPRNTWHMQCLNYLTGSSL